MLINDAQITGSLTVNASSSFQNIIVSGNILPDTTNVRNLGSVDKYFKEIYVSTGSINFVDSGSIKSTISSAPGGGIQIGSVVITTSSISFVDSTGSVTQNIAQSSSVGPISDYATSASFNSYTSSTDTILSSLQTTSASVNVSVAAINTFTSSTSARLNSIETVSSSNLSRLSSLENKSGSLATTGSNTFYGTQTFSGSVYIANDLIVQGSSSIQYITGSSVNIGTNIVQLNTANPSVRFAGLTIIDSGSIGGSGSFLYDSIQDEFIFVHRGNGTNVTSSHFVLGPETIDNLGNETYLTCNTIPKGTGKEHLVDSNIFDNGTTTCFYNSTTINSSGVLTSTNLVGTICARNGVVSGSSQVVYTSLSSIPAGIVSGSSQISLSGFSTSNLSEGTNLYYTDARVKTKLSAETVISGSGQVAIASTSGFGTYINQALLTTSSPTFCGLNLYNGISTGRSSYGVSNANLILYPSAADSTGYSGIDFRSGNNYPSDGAQIYFESNTGSSEKAKLTIRVENDLEDFMELRAGNITLNANTVSGGGQNPSIIFQNAGSTISSISNTGVYNGNISGNAATVTSGVYTSGDQTIGGIKTFSSRIIVGTFPNSTTNTGEAWFGRASDRNAGTYTIQLGGNSASSRSFEVVDYAWSVVLFSVSSGGTATASGDVVAYSDRRVKENIVTITNPLDKLLRLRGVSYNRTDLEDKSTKIGFIAQEVKDILPEVVTYNVEQDRYGISYGNMTALLVESIKEQQQQIHSLKLEVENLKKQRGI
jgi:hypothetical protein